MTESKLRLFCMWLTLTYNKYGAILCYLCRCLVTALPIGPEWLLHLFLWCCTFFLDHLQNDFVSRTRLIEYRSPPKLINELSARNCDELFTFLAFSFWIDFQIELSSGNVARFPKPKIIFRWQTKSNNRISEVLFAYIAIAECESLVYFREKKSWSYFLSLKIMIRN